MGSRVTTTTQPALGAFNKFQRAPTKPDTAVTPIPPVKPVLGMGQVGAKPMSPKMSQQAAMVSALNKAGSGAGIGYISAKNR